MQACKDFLIIWAQVTRIEILEGRQEEKSTDQSGVSRSGLKIGFMGMVTFRVSKLSVGMIAASKISITSVVNSVTEPAGASSSACNQYFL